MSDSRPKIAYLTAGAAGMYCGSCMHDNTLARALTREGVDVQLIPTYTPIRTDEQDVSVDRVFFGGINVYLQQKIPLFRYLPAMLDRLFDMPWLIRWATSKATSISPAQLGALTVSMLKGAHGYQRKEVRRLSKWLEHHVRPDIVVLSNMLIGGCIPGIKKRNDAPVLVTLQGDDIFLDALPEPHKERAFAEIRRIVDQVDGFIANSRYYANHMADYFSIRPEKIHVAPLGLDTEDFAAVQQPFNSGPATIGYLARLAPEKGLHVLADAFILLRKREGTEDARLQIAGWLGENNREYAEGVFEKLRAAGLEDAYHYVGSVDRKQKLDFLSQLDVLSVPTTYSDPKGLYVLEALAAGVPVVQPDHGAFPELLTATGGGRLVRPEDPQHLADELHRLLGDPNSRQQLAQQGRHAVHQNHNATAMAKAMLEIYKRYL